MLPHVFHLDFVDFFIKSYFRFIDDVIHQWWTDFDINLFGQILKDLDPDLKYELDQIACHAHYMDYSITATHNAIFFDVYYKPTNAFTYLKFNSCHPRHTINNLAGSLARRIINIISNNREQQLNELSDHMLARGHPRENIVRSISNTMVPPPQPHSGEPIVFTRTHSPRLVIDERLFRESLLLLQNQEMKKAFHKK